MADKTFTSSALGYPMQYKDTFFADADLVLLAKTDSGGDLPCKKPTDTNFSYIHHNSDQVRQVLADFDASQATT